MAEQKRGPGRPKGSKNKPKKPASGKDTMAVQAIRSQQPENRRRSTGRPNAASSLESVKPYPVLAEEYRRRSVRMRILAGLVMLVLGVVFALSLHMSLLGVPGEKLANFAAGMFGFGGNLVAYALIIFGILSIIGKTATYRISVSIFTAVLCLSLVELNAVRFFSTYHPYRLDNSDLMNMGIKGDGGGLIGMKLGSPIYNVLGQWIYLAVFVVVIVLMAFLIIRTPLSERLEEAHRDRWMDNKWEARQQQEYDRADRERRSQERQLEKEHKKAQRSSLKAHEEEAAQMQMNFEKARMQAKKEAQRTMYSGNPNSTKNAPSIASSRPISDFDRDQIDKKEKPVSPNRNNKIQKAVDKAHITYEEESKPDTNRLRNAKKQIVDLVANESNLGKQSRYSAKNTGTGLGLNGNAGASTQAGKGLTGYIPKETPVKKETTSEPIPVQGLSSEPTVTTSNNAMHGISDTTMAAATGAAVYDGAARVVKNPGDVNRVVRIDGSQENKTAVPAATPGEGPVVGGESNATAASVTESSESEVSETPRKGNYKMPPVTLLNPPRSDGRSNESEQELRERAITLEQTLASFHVDAKIVNIISGPSVTRFELEPARGVKVQSITKLADDIALNLMARSIRIEAPIPGKAAVGIEIENETRQMVGFREIVDSQEFKKHKSKMAFAVGRDIGGKPVVADLAKMPHLLIAGATGSGKSVCINTLICSILYKARPEEVKMVLVDPKMVELGNYNGIPHLLIPVVTDANKAAAALNWAVSEMTDRYKKFAANGVRDISGYNKLMKQKGEKDEILSQVVIIIDELADLMMVASQQVEDAICRLAQLARAAGMHLVIATQRPSVDVITGLIKANVPSRIAFTVSSQIDSRTIIDMPGAEKLVGNGDMLFKPQDLNKPKRIQGPFIDDDEVERIIAYVKDQSLGEEYDNAVIEHIEKGNSYQGGSDEDELLEDAIETIINAGQASVSMLQRRFRIGYNRAARMIEDLEVRGIVGPQDGSRPRQVLMTQEEFDNMRNSDN